ncbi:MFS transporter [Paenibacillus senegalensis]|uniref:MFS transporter n=1 Tax=Paenibacillus senegalensis TaxID=1465766 RepID=UPI00028A2BC7|nr:MFS transporter [Paenibacillus senegalensis]
MLTIWRLAPREIKVLYTAYLFINLGFYAFIPYLTLYLTGSFAWSMALAGVLLGVRQFSQQGVTFIGGIVADRLGCKPALILGLLVRSIGFASFAFCSETWHFFISAILSGLGGALFEPSYQAAFVKLAPQEYRKPLFSFKNLIVNVAMIASTFLGSLLISIDFVYLSLITGSIYLAIAFAIYLLLPNLQVETSQHSVLQDMGKILRDGPFVFYTVVLIGYFYLYMQLYLTIPIKAQALTGQEISVAYVYATLAVTVIIGQLPMIRYLERFPNRFPLIGAGAVFMGIGLLGFGLSGNLLMLCASAVLFALGTMIAAPLQLDVIPSFADSRLLASYYGFNGYSLAVGGALSTSAGGWFYDLGERLGLPLLPWLICLAVSLIVAVCLYFFKDARADTSGTS